MSDEHPPGHPPADKEKAVEPAGGTLIEETRGQLEPLLTSVLEALAADRNRHPETFFAELLERLRHLNTEFALLQLFFDLATTPFKSFEFSAAAASAVDELLARCESIALTMTAEDDRQH